MGPLRSLRRDGPDRLSLAVGVVALLATTARLVRLGERVAHYDEGWVGYWTLRYAATGDWAYRPLVHGPFYPHVNRVVFELFGVSDVTARLAPALVGGLLPLVALLYRDRLRAVEVFAVAVLLAANPILVYFSRFMRFDLPLAAFVLLTVGLVLRAVDREDPRYLLAAGAAFAVAFATKENVVLYPVSWLAASLLVVNDRLLLADRTPAAELRATLRAAAARTRDWATHLVAATLVFLAVFVFFFAPRVASDPNAGLWAVGRDPTLLPSVLDAAVVGSLSKAAAFWVSGGHQGHPYLPYLSDYLATLAEGAPVVCLAAVVGFLSDRFGDDGPRPLVGFAFVWGVLAVVGYPLANLFKTPWSTVHAVAPLVLPAGVGVGLLARRVWAGLAGVTGTGGGSGPDDGADPGLLAGRTATRLAAVGCAALLVASAGLTGATVVRTSYERPMDGDSELVYLSQPESQIHPTLDAVETAIDGNDGTDVLYYGEFYNVSDESVADRPPAYGGWHARLPLPWYFEAMDATVDSTTNQSHLRRERPPVVVAHVSEKTELDVWLGGYVTVKRDLSQPDKTTLFLVRRDRLPADSPWAERARNESRQNRLPAAAARP
jgi:uncharacterized protein (TIGR03663 family)